MINNSTMIDVTEQIIPNYHPRYFNDDESLELYNTCLHLMEEFIKENPTIITDPDFEEIFEENIQELMHLPFDFDIFYTTDAEEEMEQIIEQAKDDFRRLSEDFVEFRNRIVSKFKLKTWYKTPKDDNLIFLIDSFNPGNMSVKLNVKSKDTGLFKKLEIDEEQFNNFLYQYSLDDFENMY